MFEQLQALPDDPILSLIGLYAEDTNPNKVDLGAGVYKDEQGNAPIMTAVKRAEQYYIDHQLTKTYTGIAGDAEFNQAMEKLVFGADHSRLNSGRLRTVQTPGSCGGLFLAAQLIKRSNPDACIWVSNPTWGNHYAIFESAHLSIKEYPYYQTGMTSIDFDGLMSTLSQQAKAGDAVLLHGCCHNPAGADLTNEQWQAVTQLVLDKGLIPLIDQAYQGLGTGLDEDAYGVRYMADKLPELLVSVSCSKNFTVYRERTGCLSVIASTAIQTDNAYSQILAAARASYSIPPASGAAIVKTVLNSEELYPIWRQELDSMRDRIIAMRTLLVDNIHQRRPDIALDYLKDQKGMFSFLPLNKQQILTLRKEKSIYMVNSGRISFTGMTQANANYVAESIAAIL